MNQKAENLLQLSLIATPAEREKSPILMSGYSPSENEWELIVKYHGNLQQYNSEYVKISTLIAGYAIVVINENYLDSFLALEEVEYVEKPKSLYFSWLPVCSYF